MRKFDENETRGQVTRFTLTTVSEREQAAPADASEGLVPAGVFLEELDHLVQVLCGGVGLAVAAMITLRTQSPHQRCCKGRGSL